MGLQFSVIPSPAGHQVGGKGGHREEQVGLEDMESQLGRWAGLMLQRQAPSRRPRRVSLGLGFALEGRVGGETRQRLSLPST